MKWWNAFNPVKLAHALGIEASASNDIFHHGFPDVLLQFGGGIGDELLLTTVARELKKRDPGLKVWQVSKASELLEGNPDYHRVFDLRHWPLRYAFLLNSRRRTLHYSVETAPRKQEESPTEPILSILCRKAGITGQIAARPYVSLSEQERAKGRIAPRQIAVQCVGPASYENVMLNKLWPPERFGAVIETLRTRWPDCAIIEIGSAKDPHFSGTVDLRGKTSFRETAAILSESLCFVGTVGFLMHLARAVDCRSVIIYGGREHSWQTGYGCNENLDSFVPCAPCWLWNDCNFGHGCMKQIEAKQVIDAIDRAMQKFGTPLASDLYEVDSRPAAVPHLRTHVSAGVQM